MTVFSLVGNRVFMKVQVEIIFSLSVFIFELSKCNKCTSTAVSKMPRRHRWYFISPCETETTDCFLQRGDYLLIVSASKDIHACSKMREFADELDWLRIRRYCAVSIAVIVRHGSKSWTWYRAVWVTLWYVCASMLAVISALDESVETQLMISKSVFSALLIYDLRLRCRCRSTTTIIRCIRLTRWHVSDETMFSDHLLAMNVCNGLCLCLHKHCDRQAKLRLDRMT